MVVILAALGAVVAAQAPIEGATTYTAPTCAAAPESDVCKLDLTRTAAEVEAGLGGRATAWRAEGDRLVVFARRPEEAVQLCCATRTSMDRIPGTDLWSVTLRVRDLDRAVIDILVNQDPENRALPAFLGPKAPPAPLMAEALAGTVAHETVDSVALGEPRKLSAYTPPGFRPGRRYPVVYMADGQVLEGYARIIDPLIRRGELPPVVLVGVWPNQADPSVNWRRLEWVVGQDPDRFARVEAFLLNEVIPLAERKYGASTRRDERMIWGTSAGAAWSLVMSQRRPDLFGRVVALSGGSGEAATIAAADGPPLFLAAGRFEPEYLRVNRELAARARAAGREVVLKEPAAGHSFLTWQPLLPEALRWAFGDGRKRGPDGL